MIFKLISTLDVSPYSTPPKSPKKDAGRRVSFSDSVTELGPPSAQGMSPAVRRSSYPFISQWQLTADLFSQFGYDYAAILGDRNRAELRFNEAVELVVNDLVRRGVIVQDDGIGPIRNIDVSVTPELFRYMAEPVLISTLLEKFKSDWDRSAKTVADFDDIFSTWFGPLVGALHALVTEFDSFLDPFDDFEAAKGFLVTPAMWVQIRESIPFFLHVIHQSPLVGRPEPEVSSPFAEILNRQRTFPSETWDSVISWLKPPVESESAVPSMTSGELKALFEQLPTLIRGAFILEAIRYLSPASTFPSRVSQIVLNDLKGFSTYFGDCPNASRRILSLFGLAFLNERLCFPIAESRIIEKTRSDDPVVARRIQKETRSQPPVEFDDLMRIKGTTGNFLMDLMQLIPWHFTECAAKEIPNWNSVETTKVPELSALSGKISGAWLSQMTGIPSSPNSVYRS